MVGGNKVDNQLTLGHGDHSGLSEVGRVGGNLIITRVLIVEEGDIETERDQVRVMSCEENSSCLCWL